MDETTSMLISTIRTFALMRGITLSNEAVQIDVIGALETKVLSANVIDRLIVNHKGAI